MSTLKVTNIQATGETASREVSGIAGAWSHFSTVTTTALVNSSNVSSLTDNGTGSTNVNFTNNFANNDYAIGANANDYHATTSGSNTSSTARVVVSSSSHVATDRSVVSQLVVGDLA